MDTDNRVTPVAVTSAAVAPAGRQSRAHKSVVGIVSFVVALPFIVLAVRAARSHWLTFSDWGPMELRVRDVGTSHLPLVGPYSRYGWSHPGPIVFYLLALPY